MNLDWTTNTLIHRRQYGKKIRLKRLRTTLMMIKLGLYLTTSALCLTSRLSRSARLVDHTKGFHSLVHCLPPHAQQLCGLRLVPVRKP